MLISVYLKIYLAYFINQGLYSGYAVLFFSFPEESNAFASIPAVETSTHVPGFPGSMTVKTYIDR